MVINNGGERTTKRGYLKRGMKEEDIKMVSLRISVDEYNAFITYAKEESHSLSAWVREQCLRRLTEKNDKPDKKSRTK